jgi:uncharacterized damage-inducible protein DinB
MSFVERFRSDFAQEMKSTRPVIERVPGERVEWRPHPKSFPLGHLTQLVARMPSWIANMATQPQIDLAKTPGYSFETSESMLREFDEAVREATTALSALKESQLEDSWSLMTGGQLVVAEKRGNMLGQTLRHLVHHRGQMTVYLRLLDVPVPITYGPTADDRGSFGI